MTHRRISYSPPHQHVDTPYGVDPECPTCQHLTVGRSVAYTKIKGALIDPREFNKVCDMPVLEWLEMEVGVQEGRVEAIAKQAVINGLYEVEPLTDEQLTQLRILYDQIGARIQSEEHRRQR